MVQEGQVGQVVKSCKRGQWARNAAVSNALRTFHAFRECYTHAGVRSLVISPDLRPFFSNAFGDTNNS